MTFGAGTFGSTAFGSAAGAGGGPADGQSILPLRVIVAAGEVGRKQLQLRLRIGHRGASALPLSINVGHVKGVSSLPLAIAVASRGTTTLALSVTVSAPYTPPAVGEQPFVWSVRVELGGQDVSARLTGVVEVDAEEAAARVAKFALAPVGTYVVLADYIDAPVTITFKKYENDVLVGQWRLFTGFVDMPEHDAATHVIAFTCTDRLQKKLAAMTRAQIDALVPKGVWSAYVFDRYVKNDEYLRDRVSTTAGAVDADAYGALAWSAWNGVAARTLDDDVILDGSVHTRLAPANSARNVRLDMHYKRPRVRVRGIPFRYDAPSASEQMYRGLRALTRASVEQALSGTGATIAGSVTFFEYPPATVVPGKGVLIAQDPGALCMGAMCTLNRRYSQWIDESWEVQIGTTGTRVDDERAVNVEWDTSDNDHYLAPANAVTAFMALQQTGPVPYIPPRYTDGETIVEYVPPGQPDAAAFGKAWRATILAAARTVAESLRGSSIGFAVALDPGITLRDYLAIDCMHVTGSGKVSRVSHKMDIAAGSAISEVEIECVSVVLPNVPAPVRQAIPSDIKPGNSVCKAETWIGGLADSRPWDETVMFGFSGNDTATGSAANNRYPEQFSVMVPGIEDEAMGTVAVPPRCTMTAGSTVLEALTSTDGFEEGIEIQGVGIPAGAKVVSVDNAARTVTLTGECTSTGADREVRVKSRTYIGRLRVQYAPTINRNGPVVRG